MGEGITISLKPLLLVQGLCRCCFFGRVTLKPPPPVWTQFALAKSLPGTSLQYRRHQHHQHRQTSSPLHISQFLIDPSFTTPSPSSFTFAATFRPLHLGLKFCLQTNLFVVSHISCKAGAHATSPAETIVSIQRCQHVYCIIYSIGAK